MWCLLPVLYLEILWLVGGHRPSFGRSIENILFVALAIGAGFLGRITRVDEKRWNWSYFGLGLFLINIVTMVAAWIDPSTLMVYLASGLTAGFFLSTSHLFQQKSFVWRAIAGVLASILYAGVNLALYQIKNEFADEEFFSFLQGFLLGIFWFLTWIAYERITTGRGDLRMQGISFLPKWPGIGLALFFVVLGYSAITAYQRSFFPDTAPVYAGIDEEHPLICGTAEPSKATWTGKDVFDKIIQAVQANSQRSAADSGFLALATGENRWLAEFHQSLMEEVAKGQFTQPVGSVKYGQFEAAMRAYYYARVEAAFPDLFSPDEKEAVRLWFAQINQRALTVEWVDWAYSLAFREWPKGPYNNQEIGAGLLASLETERLAAPELAAQNSAYLKDHNWGWKQRFRVSDDSLFYQQVWITNALFQSQYFHAAPNRNQENAFAWLVAQALPDGGMVGYNPSAISLAWTAYLGAEILNDPEMLWLAGRSVDNLLNLNGYLRAYTGLEKPVGFSSASPTTGSCLIYGNSGLPYRAGPLAPDKIVFRSGWEDESKYLLMNLRFTGWHRYKATNDIALIYQGEPLVVDHLTESLIKWLPIGRSQVRDKRIPRENLNGLLIEQKGWATFVYNVTGIGSLWAQNPPAYAKVEKFSTSQEVSESVTSLEDWDGWDYSRRILFYTHGPIIVVDSAKGNDPAQSAVNWHVVSTGSITDGRIGIGKSSSYELVLRDQDSGKIEVIPDTSGALPLNTITYHSSKKGSLFLVSVFLPKDWKGAQVDLVEDHGILKLSINPKNESLCASTTACSVELGKR